MKNKICPTFVAFIAIAAMAWSITSQAAPDEEREPKAKHQSKDIKTLNGLGGDVVLSAGPGVTITQAENGLKISGVSVVPTSINGLTGLVTLLPGSGITFTPAGNGFTIGAQAVVPSNAWNTTGNAGTTAGVNFLGTTDDQPLELKVNGQRALRLEMNTNGAPNVIGGAGVNYTSSRTVGAVIGGGGALNYDDPFHGFGSISITNSVFGDFGVIGGGGGNGTERGASFSNIGGGLDNTVQLPTSVIAGGFRNSIQGFAGSLASSVIGGGRQNGIFQADNGTVGGGAFNVIFTAANNSTISGGFANSVRGKYATIPGGFGNAAFGDNTFAAGSGAFANHRGAFVWADSARADSTVIESFSSTALNQFAVRASGGVIFFSDTNATVGVQLAAGGNSWAPASDRNLKKNFQPVNGREVLSRVLALPIQTYNMKTQDPSIRHIGPMAQDFAAAFAVGEDNKHIATVDADGVALAAIQGLNEIVNEKDAKIADLEKRLEKLEKLLAPKLPNTADAGQAR